jgi:hypothetical protein
MKTLRPLRRCRRALSCGPDARIVPTTPIDHGMARQTVHRIVAAPGQHLPQAVLRSTSCPTIDGGVLYGRTR